jgi:hypothetical protein
MLLRLEKSTVSDTFLDALQRIVVFVMRFWIIKFRVKIPNLNRTTERPSDIRFWLNIFHAVISWISF